MITSIEKSDGRAATDVLSALKRLMKINNDRARFYTFALRETEDDSLKDVFRRYLIQSTQFMNGLSIWIASYGGQQNSAELELTWQQRFWMKVRRVLPSIERGDVINSCEFREAKSVKTYRQILAANKLPYEAYIEIRRQKEHVEKAFMELATLSDSN